MKFEIFGPFSLPKKANGLVDFSRLSKKAFWADVEELYPGLPAACGCYVFAASGPNGALPHYVGMANKQTFEGECSQKHVLSHINDAISGRAKLKPKLYLIAKITPQGRFAKVSANKQKDITFLENHLIALAFDRNENLGNIQGTRFLKGMTVRGFFNPAPGPRPSAASSFAAMIRR